MTYSVTRSERWDDVRLFFEAYPEAAQQLLAQVGGNDPSCVFEALSVKGMLEAVTGRVPYEWMEKRPQLTVDGWCRMVGSMREGLERLMAFMENTVPPLTYEQRKKTRGTKPASIEEAVLMTLKTCFTLHGLESAQQLTVYEYMMARKEAYNAAVVAYNQSVADGGFAADIGGKLPQRARG